MIGCGTTLTIHELVHRRHFQIVSGIRGRGRSGRPKVRFPLSMDHRLPARPMLVLGG